MSERLSVRCPMTGNGEISKLSWHRRARIVADTPSQDLEADPLKDRHGVLPAQPRYPQDGKPPSVPRPYPLSRPAFVARARCPRWSVPRRADLLCDAPLCSLGLEVRPDELINHEERKHDSKGDEGFAHTPERARPTGDRGHLYLPGEGVHGRLLPWCHQASASSQAQVRLRCTIVVRPRLRGGLGRFGSPRPQSRNDLRAASRCPTNSAADAVTPILRTRTVMVHLSARHLVAERSADDRFSLT
jgi:hypothetical protein